MKVEGFFSLDHMVSECLEQSCDVPGSPPSLEHSAGTLLSGGSGNYLVGLTSAGGISLHAKC